MTEFKCPYSSCRTRIVLKTSDVSRYKASRARDHLLCCKGIDSNGDAAQDDIRVRDARRGLVSGKRTTRVCVPIGESSDCAIVTHPGQDTFVVCNDQTHASLQQQIDTLRAEGIRESEMLRGEMSNMKQMLVDHLPGLTFPIDDAKLRLRMDEYATSCDSYSDILSSNARLNDQNKKLSELLAQVIENWDSCNKETVRKMYTTIRLQNGHGPIRSIIRKKSPTQKMVIPERAVRFHECMEWEHNGRRLQTNDD